MRQSYHRFLCSLLPLLAVALLGPVVGHAQSTGIVQGRVVDAADGTPLPGANVVVDGTTLGTSTGQNGRFELRNVPAGSQTLTVSYVSYQQKSQTVEVESGATITVTLEIESRVLEGGEVVVTGLRGSQFRSATQKKQSINIVDALAADRIGNLPEKNVAEAVQRLPGIVMRNDRTEGRFVSIRGGAANLNNVTLNGNTLASTAGSRATALDLLPAEMVSNVEVTKAVTPDMPANAIGGSVNISTLTAFDREGAFAFGSIRGLQHDQQVPSFETAFPFRANLTAGTQVGPNDNIGLLVSASGSRRDFTTSGLKAENWNWANEEDLPTTNVPEGFEQVVERNKRSRFALNTSFDWRPTDQTSGFVRPYFTYTDEAGIDNELEYVLKGGEDAGPTITENGSRFPAGYGSVDLSRTDEEESLWGTNVGFEHRFGSALTWSASGTYSRGYLERGGPDGEFQTPGEDSVNPQASGVADMTNFLFNFYPENPQYIGDASNYTANPVDVEYQENTENTYAAKTDVRLPFEFGALPGYLKAGGQIEMRDKSVDAADIEFNYAGDGSLSLADYAAPSVQTVQVGNSLFPFADTEAFANDFLNNVCQPPGNRLSGDRTCQNPDSPYEINTEEVQTEDVENDSENEESIYAGYAMASAEFGPLTALAGARIEYTSTSSTRFQLLENDNTGNLTTTSQTFDNSYTDVLPSVHLTFEATDNLQFRGAWTNTLGRPDYEKLSSFSEVTVEGSEAEVIEGNPNLKPFKAMNVDLTAEYYFSDGGLASVAGFYKQIDNPIYRFTETETDVSNPFGDGRTFNRVQRTQERNADSGSVLGLEATYQQSFTFLPAPLNGLGLNSNLTVTDSEVDVPNRGDLPFFQQADLVYNIVPYFQKGGFEARVAINYRGDYLLSLSEFAVNDTYVAERTTVDFNASYQLEGLIGNPELLVQVENVTNEPEVEYAGGDTNRLSSHYLSGRAVAIGLSMEF
ncbi:TonB-dependent receptor [Salinibacter sp. 10B]|uniref:TonB-dependent receptor n=1 Tax=Salinibacter sp. 10B TaxID=1923971 RepID=UPI000CF40EA0|nr:TonB-dependent receptor [Salinibacter sp. 10B]PQJ34908.1 TonB-dependent receptor [Salinibacter sp. 10B]